MEAHTEPIHSFRAKGIEAGMRFKAAVEANGHMANTIRILLAGLLY